MTPGRDPQRVLVVAGTDPSGGAGISADLHTCRTLHCWALPVVTAVVAQSSRGVAGFTTLPAELLASQWDEITADVRPAAIKLGMLGSAETVLAVQQRLAAAPGIPVVLDPVLRAGHGENLSGARLADAMELLLPHVTIITPNVPELQALTGIEIANLECLGAASRALVAMGAAAVLAKGGHLTDAPGDLLVTAEGERFFANDVVDGLDVHGTGCHLSTAIACRLAKGDHISLAVERARAYLGARIQHSRWRPGTGREVFGWWSNE